MVGVRRNILSCIGGTPMVRLRAIGSETGVDLMVKLESQNPTGSMKDRMALAIIEAAEEDGRLSAGQPVVEYTGGSTGVSLSLVCAVKDHPLHIVTSDAFAREKLDHMELLGATLHLVPSDDGKMTEALTREMIAVADDLADKEGAYWVDQLNNADPINAYHGMADEVWDQTGGEVAAFVQSVGTAGCIRGVAEGLRQHDEEVHIVAVEPSESAVLSGGPSGAHKIDGVGAGFVVPLWRDDIPDEIEAVSTEEAVDMSVRLAREEGVFGGTSTGANLVAALRSAQRLPRGSTIVLVMSDTGMKYLSKASIRAHTSR